MATRVQECLYFELFEMWRKCILAGALVLLASGSGAQVLAGLLVCVAYLSVLANLRPYCDDNDDVLQQISSTQILLTLIAGLATLAKDDADDGEARVLTAFLVFTTSATALCSLVIVVFFTCPSLPGGGLFALCGRCCRQRCGCLPCVALCKAPDEGNAGDEEADDGAEVDAIDFVAPPEPTEGPSSQVELPPRSNGGRSDHHAVAVGTSRAGDAETAQHTAEQTRAESEEGKEKGGLLTDTVTEGWPVDPARRPSSQRQATANPIAARAPLHPLHPSNDADATAIF